MGRYELVELLGEGSFAQVYRAVDSELGRDVAIKIPRKQRFNSHEHIKRFVDEARTAAKLEHPGIVRVYDIGWLSNDVCFIAMEHCTGGSLDQLLKAGSVSQVRTAEIIAEAAEAIHFAHLKGLVHRDLKPSNIMFGRDGRARIVDFGLAIADEQQAKFAGEIAGTLPFMSPEQVRGESHHLDGRTDIWSLGIIFYQMLTGRRPFVGNRKQLSDQILHREPKPLRQIDDSIPAEFELICRKCLAKPVQERWSTAADIARSLRTWLEGAQRVSTSPPIVSTETLATPETSTKALAFRKARTQLIALIGAVLVIGGGVVLWAGIGAGIGQRRDVILPVTTPVVSLDSLPLGKQFSLLERESNKLFWPVDDLTCMLHADTNAASLTINSSSEVLIELGETEASEFQLDGEIIKNAMTGASGYFWAYQADPNKPKEASCFALCLKCPGRPSPTPNYVIELSEMHFRPNKRGQPYLWAQTELASEHVSVPSLGRNLLEFRASKKNLVSVRWNGLELSALTQAYRNVLRNAPPDTSLPMRTKGRFGVFNLLGGVSVRNAHFSLISNNKG